MLMTFNGWGMRIAFVEEDWLDENPEVRLKNTVEN